MLRFRTASTRYKYAESVEEEAPGKSATSKLALRACIRALQPKSGDPRSGARALLRECRLPRAAADSAEREVGVQPAPSREGQRTAHHHAEEIGVSAAPRDVGGRRINDAVRLRLP